MSKIPEWELPIEELQSIDFRLKVSIEAPRSAEPEEYVQELKTLSLELGGISDVTVHSWKTVQGSNIEGQLIEIRLRVRVIQPRQFSSGEIVVPLKEGLREVKNVVGVYEHSWTRLARVEIPVDL